IPIVSEAAAKEARARGETVQTQAEANTEIRQNRELVAFIGPSLVGGAMPEKILGKFSKPFLERALHGTAMGETFALIRPKGEGESLLHALVVDGVFFGGTSLLGGLVGKLSTPIKIGADQLEALGATLTEKVAGLKGTEYGKALY